MRKPRIAAIIIVFLVLLLFSGTSISKAAVSVTQQISCQGVISHSDSNYYYIFQINALKQCQAVKNDGSIPYTNVDASYVINSAINDTPSGSTLFFRSGIYNITSSIIAKDNVVMTGEEGAILRASNNLNAAIIQTTPQVSLHLHEGIVIENLEIDGNRYNQGTWDMCGIQLFDCEDPILSNLYVHDVRAFGVWVLSSNPSWVSSGGQVSNCLFEGCDANGLSIGGSGGNYDGVLVSNCVFRNMSDVGLTIFGDNNTVSNCIAEDCIPTGRGESNSGWGFAVEMGNTNQFINCTASNCSDGFSTLESCAQNIFLGATDNNFTGCTATNCSNDFRIAAARTTLQDCSAYGWTTRALYVFDGGNCTITNFDAVSNSLSSYTEYVEIDAPFCEISNSNVTDTINYYGAIGITVSGASYTIVQNNIVQGFANAGLMLEVNNNGSNSTNCTITNNLCVQNAIGILINAGVTNTLITGNDLTNSTVPIMDFGTGTIIQG